MIIEYLNLQATDCAEGLLNLTQERTNEISELLSLAEAEMAENHELYTASGTPDNPGDGLHIGKVLGRIMQIAKNPNEEIAILLALHVVINHTVEAISERRALDRIKAKHPNATVIKL